MPKTGIVIPAHNEEEHIAACLQSLTEFQSNNDVIVVVDAHSQDQTTHKAESFGVHVLQANQPQRGFVIAKGIEYLRTEFPECEYVIIAHADMRFQPNSCDVFYDSLQKYPGTVWGSFGNWIQPSSFGYNIISFGNNIRARFMRLPYGDQAQFFRMDTLQQIGFPNQSRLEDLELSLRFKQESCYLFLHYPVLIPDRHWTGLGLIQTTLSNWKTVWQYRKNRNYPNFKYNGD